MNDSRLLSESGDGLASWHSDPHQQKRDQMRAALIAAARRPDAEMAVSGVCICVTQGGAIRTTVINIEPEHVEIILNEQERVADKLVAFLKQARDALGSNIVPFPFRA